tara:strand:+ start:2362 stop:3702 length:1341 start_codon:yes stop_codon:yes gene_type:complete
MLGCSHSNKASLDEVKVAHSFILQGHTDLANKWWQSFNNKELNLLVEQALGENIDLKAHQLRKKASELGISIAHSSQLPSLSFTSGANANSDELSKINTAYLGLSASWELDLWGQFEAAEDKAFWQHQEVAALTDSRAIFVAGNTVNSWLSALSEYEKQQVLTKQHQRTNAALKVISRRFALGKNSVTNIWQQEKLLKSIEVKQNKNKAALYLAKQRLALWLGESDETKIDILSSQIPTLPPLPELGIPLEKLQKRPDIRQALAKIKAANESVTIAIAEQFPRLTLRANYNTNKNSVADLFDDWSGNLIAALVVPIFDNQKKSNVVKQKQLQLQALIFEYQQVWLEAIASVNKALVNEQQLAAVVKNVKHQVYLAKKTEQLTTIKYLHSKAGFINLLNAQEDILALELQLIEANKLLLLNRTLLYRELSHGDFIPLENNQLIVKEH